MHRIIYEAVAFSKYELNDQYLMSLLYNKNNFKIRKPEINNAANSQSIYG